MNRKDLKDLQKIGKKLSPKLQSIYDKSESAARKPENLRINREIGDNNTNQYRKSGRRS